MIRRATDADRETLHTLWDEFAGPTPPPVWAPEARTESLSGIDESIAAGAAAVAEEDGEVVGFACGVAGDGPLGELTELYVRPHARRRGIAKALVAEVAGALADGGVRYVRVDVATENTVAQTFYDRAGFRAEMVRLIADTQTLLGPARSQPRGRSFGSLHIQTDDQPAVERAVRQFVPRLPGRSRGSVVAPPRGGWVAVYDDAAGRDPQQLRRLAREISDRMGAVVLAIGVEHDAVVRYVLFERGRIVDEYLSVQEYYGPLPPGEVVALAANPRVVARLTGADPGAVRAAAQHAASPSELPPPRDVLSELARAIGIEGAEHGWEDAPDIAGSVRVDR